MQKILRTGVILLATAWLAACQTTAELAQKNAQALAWEPGKAYTGSFNLSRFDVPLPPGEWVFIGGKFTTNNARQVIETARLAQTKNKAVKHLIVLVATQTPGSGKYKGWSNVSQCSGYGMAIWDNIKGYAIEQDCWGIGGADISHIYTEEYAGAVMNKLGLKMVHHAISTKHHFADAKNFLDVYLYTPNEELRATYGTKVPSDFVEWVKSPSRLASDQIKAFMRDIAQDIQPRHTAIRSIFAAPK